MCRIFVYLRNESLWFHAINIFPLPSNDFIYRNFITKLHSLLSIGVCFLLFIGPDELIFAIANPSAEINFTIHVTVSSNCIDKILNWICAHLQCIVAWLGRDAMFTLDRCRTKYWYRMTMVLALVRSERSYSHWQMCSRQSVRMNFPDRECAICWCPMWTASFRAHREMCRLRCVGIRPLRLAQLKCYWWTWSHACRAHSIYWSSTGCLAHCHCHGRLRHRTLPRCAVFAGNRRWKCHSSMMMRRPIASRLATSCPLCSCLAIHFRCAVNLKEKNGNRYSSIECRVADERVAHCERNEGHKSRIDDHRRKIYERLVPKWLKIGRMELIGGLAGQLSSPNEYRTHSY